MHIHIRMLLVLLFLITPFKAVSSNIAFPQTFRLTAYYSPQPHQCCYVRGGLTAEKIMNGQGIQAADGTPVYAGMAAAPSSYEYGTVISLPGIGTVKVHDRGGAISELTSGEHRLDIWVGEGEIALARALSFGEKVVEGTVYPIGTVQPEVSLNLDAFDASWDKLKVFVTAAGGLLTLSPRANEKSLSAMMLQNTLKDLGYLNHPVTSLFGPFTRRALRVFLREMGVSEPSTVLTETTAAYLQAAQMFASYPVPVSFVGKESSARSITHAKRALRFLGYFDGRTSGTYDHALFRAIYSFQRDHGIVSSTSEKGAGRIGPQTITSIQSEWKKKHIARLAQNIRLLRDVSDAIVGKAILPDQFVGVGESGTMVYSLQRELAEKGFFPDEEINGSFGPLTKDAVFQYQLSRGIVKDKSDSGAGYVGPSTLRNLKKEKVNDMYSAVRAHGWENVL